VFLSSLRKASAWTAPGFQPDPTVCMCTFFRPCRKRKKWVREVPLPGRAVGAEWPIPSPSPSSRWTCPLAAPVPHHLLAHRRGRHLGEFWLSPDAPTAPLKQKTRFKIRAAKCHLRPRSRERAKEALRQPLLGEWPPSPAYRGGGCVAEESPSLGSGGLRVQQVWVSKGSSLCHTTLAPSPRESCLGTADNGHVSWEEDQHSSGKLESSSKDHCPCLTQNYVTIPSPYPARLSTGPGCVLREGIAERENGREQQRAQEGGFQL
jgi:hypothetical protein